MKKLIAVIVSVCLVAVAGPAMSALAADKPQQAVAVDEQEVEVVEAVEDPDIELTAVPVVADENVTLAPAVEAGAPKCIPVSGGSPVPVTELAFQWTSEDKYDDGNASLYTTITNPGGAEITSAGVNIWDANGNLLKSHTEPFNYTTKTIQLRYNVKDKLGLLLKPDTQYFYQFFALVGENAYFADKTDFLTNGGTTDRNAPVITVETVEVLRTGFKVTFSASDAEDGQVKSISISGSFQDNTKVYNLGTYSNIANGQQVVFTVDKSQLDNRGGGFFLEIEAKDSYGNMSRWSDVSSYINGGQIPVPQEVIVLREGGHIKNIDGISEITSYLHNAKWTPFNINPEIATIDFDNEEIVPHVEGSTLLYWVNKNDGKIDSVMWVDVSNADGNVGLSSNSIILNGASDSDNGATSSDGEASGSDGGAAESKDTGVEVGNSGYYYYYYGGGMEEMEQAPISGYALG